MPKTPPPPPEEKTISVPEAARRLRRATSNIRRNLALGQLHGRKVLGRWEVFEAHVNEILVGRPGSPTITEDASPGRKAKKR